MVRTCHRPLPDQRLQPTTALFFGVLLTVSGLLYLTFAVNALGALVISAIVVTYLFVYTPLKQKTSLCTVAGAFPGALPPVIGWVAARGTLNTRGVGAFCNSVSLATTTLTVNRVYLS